MKLSPEEQESIIGLLIRIYTDICEIEQQYQLFIGEGDFRPRIEHFHDAIRAYSSQKPEHFEDGGRLGIELLNYDLSCLRYILSMPLSPFTPNGEMLSPSADMVALDHKLVAQKTRPDRKTKERLVELYQNYSVLFAALLKPQADDDYHERTDDLNNDVKNINTIIEQLKTNNMNGVAQTMQNLEDEQLHKELVALIQHENGRSPENIKKLIRYLKERLKRKDKQMATIEKAYMDYGLNQLSLFENSRDMLKKMAAQGMNLVGNFVEASIAETRREMGR
ncbi:MAG: hypothetical protein ACN2B6_09035 [Rickettsiales bacterium]